LFAQEPEPRHLYVAHQYWKSTDRCFTIRVSVIDLSWTVTGEPTSKSEWRTLFDSQPCIKPAEPFDDSETGGRLAWADGSLLVTVGDHGFAGLNGDTPHSQNDDVDYGKILKIDPVSGVYSIFSRGHRNAQGLTVARDGRIWSSEHGPQGGDELNLIVEGENYGWPYVTYGTSYGSNAWPLNPDGQNHGSYKEPAFAFVPSIATSALIEISGNQFPRWDGDLLLSSLRTRALFRIRHKEGRVIYVEPIGLGERVRDLTQSPDGRIVVWSDAGVIIELSRSTMDSAFNRFCKGCHAPDFGAAAGPTLNNIVGRNIASVSGFAYSPSLLNQRGKWTEASLNAFLTDPESFAPGTTMKLIGLDEASREAVIAYLMENSK